MSDVQAKLQEIILNASTPLVIKNWKIPWKCFEKSLNDWCSDYQQNVFNFETAKKKHFDSPQWETFRKEKPILLGDFLNCQEKKINTLLQDNWAALSYRNILELPQNMSETINFRCFGFSDIEEKDATFWLSSEGSNTSCHYDTYGCNIVVQVYGRKLWLLFPPSAKLTSIRTPYEESSVYCSENFYSPNDLRQFEDIQNDCYKCILEPGDTLIIPRHWWHYVETLETSLSINHWIPLKIDQEAQLDECIVKYLIENFFMHDEINTDLLNPNQISEITKEPQLLLILDKLCKDYLETNKQDHQNKKLCRDKKYPYQYLSNEKLSESIENLGHPIQYLIRLNAEEFLKQVRINSLRFDEKLAEENKSQFDHRQTLKNILINAICNPNVISSIRNLIVTKYEKSLLKTN